MAVSPRLRQLVLLLAAIAIVGGVAIASLAPRPAVTEREGHLSARLAKITFSDGTTRTVEFQGLGCSASICSRDVIRSKAEGSSLENSTWLDTVSVIKDTSEGTPRPLEPAGMNALVVFKDGTERRMSVVPDFRFLYFLNQSGSLEKMDLAKVQSLEFIAPARANYLSSWLTSLF